MGHKISQSGLVSLDYDFDKDFEKKDYEPWLKKLVNETLSKFGANPRFDFDELMSEAWLALVESSKTFDTAKSNSFLGYAKPYVYYRLLEYISTNMYTFKVRYYNIKDDPEKLERVNLIEKGILTESKTSSDNDEGLTPLETATSGMDVESIVASKEECDVVRDAVNNDLPKRVRKAIIRRYKYDETYKEIGKQLGCSAEAARNLINKGLDKLKYKVKDAGITSS